MPRRATVASLHFADPDCAAPPADYHGALADLPPSASPAGLAPPPMVFASTEAPAAARRAVPQPSSS